MEIKYCKSLEEPLLSIIKERMSTVADAFPRWCTLVIVRYEEDGDENPNNLIASVEIEYKYRLCRLIIYPQFLTDDEWQGTLLHELHHVIFVPYTKVAENIVNTFVSDD